MVQLIDARHVVIAGNDCCLSFAVVDLPEVRYHWFQLPHPPGLNAGLLADRPLVYDITNSSEAPSIIEQVVAVWPATSSNF